MPRTTDPVVGDKKLKKKLKRLSDKGTRRVVRSALSRGMTPVARAFRAAAPVGPTKALKKSVGKRNKKSRKTGQHEAKVGFNVGGGKRKAPHAHLVTLGTAQRRTSTGAFRGKVTANNIGEKAWSASQGQFRSAFNDGIRKGLEREAKRG